LPNGTEKATLTRATNVPGGGGKRKKKADPVSVDQPRGKSLSLNEIDRLSCSRYSDFPCKSGQGKSHRRQENPEAATARDGPGIAAL